MTRDEKGQKARNAFVQFVIAMAEYHDMRHNDIQVSVERVGDERDLLSEVLGDEGQADWDEK